MNTCETCRYYMASPLQEPCESCRWDGVIGHDPPNWKGPTKGDRIRSMTDEELSAFLGSIVHDWGQGTAEIEGAGYVIDDWLAWLREEGE